MTTAPDHGAPTGPGVRHVAIASAAVAGSVRRFDLPGMHRVWYGRGCADELGEQLAGLGARRALLVTTPSTAARNPAVARLREQLGERVVACFDEARAHVPTATVVAAAQLARDHAADVVISVGGGSAVDCGKAVSLCAPGARPVADALERFAIRGQADTAFEIPPFDREPLPHVTLSTTLSAAEFTPTFTVTNERTRVKDMYHDRRLTPAVAFLDAAVAQATPAWLWAASGVRAIDHCVEWTLSLARTPFTDALARAALGELVAQLPRSIGDPPDLDARQRLQVAAWMSVFGSVNILGGLSHAIGHQLGSHCGVAHGHTSCVILPHVLDFNRPAAAERLADLAAVFGHVDGSADERSARFVADLRDLIAQLGLPGRLSDVGVGEADLAPIARATMGEVAIVNNPRPVQERDVLSILRNAL